MFFLTTLGLLDIICLSVTAIKYNGHFTFTKNPIAGKLSCVPVFSVVQESGHPLILSSGSGYFTLSFSNPYDAISLLTELIQSRSNDDKSNLWKIKASTLDTWISKMKDDKKFCLKHKLIHSSFGTKLKNTNEFEVYYCNGLTLDGKMLIFFDISDLESEIKRCPKQNRRDELKNNIQSTCLIELITNDSNNLENYSFVPSKRALEYLTSRRI